MHAQPSLRVRLQAHHLRNHSSLLSSLEANPSHHARGNRMSSSDVKRASARQLGQTLGHETLLRVKAKLVQRSTQARSHRPQVVRLQTKGVLMGLSRAYFSLLPNIWHSLACTESAKLLVFGHDN